MARPLHWSAQDLALYSGTERFDPWAMAWTAGSEGVAGQGAGEAVTPLVALARLFGGRARRVPIGVIGPREATAGQLQLAEVLGRALAESGLQLLCGGKGGVMEAACKGALEAGGSPIGLLPDTEWDAANPYVAIPIATGIGQARNAIIARACLVLVAVGGGYGTLSEMALGLHFDRLVLTLDDAPKVPGAVACATVGDAMDRIAAHLLRIG